MPRTRLHTSRSRDGCILMREALSAEHDGEAPPAGVSPAAVRDHLVSCGGCAAFATALPDLDVRSQGRAVTSALPSTSAILTRLAAPGITRGPSVVQLRWLVGLAGASQLLLAVPMLLGLMGPDVHAGRDLGALQLALGVGLALAALQPRRAAGVLPVAAVVAASTVVIAAIDVATGAASVAGELTHLSELIGVAALWALTRRATTSPAAPATVATT